jgi:hypothetical protein
LREADMTGARLRGTNLHAILDDGARWSAAHRGEARPIDEALLSAEAWRPPPPPEGGVEPLRPLSEEPPGR